MPVSFDIIFDPAFTEIGQVIEPVDQPIQIDHPMVAVVAQNPGVPAPDQLVFMHVLVQPFSRVIPGIIARAVPVKAAPVLVPVVRQYGSYRLKGHQQRQRAKHQQSFCGWIF